MVLTKTHSHPCHPCQPYPYRKLFSSTSCEGFSGMCSFMLGAFAFYGTWIWCQSEWEKSFFSLPVVVSVNLPQLFCSIPSPLDCLDYAEIQHSSSQSASPCFCPWRWEHWSEELVRGDTVQQILTRIQMQMGFRAEHRSWESFLSSTPGKWAGPFYLSSNYS